MINMKCTLTNKIFPIAFCTYFESWQFSLNSIWLVMMLHMSSNGSVNVNVSYSIKHFD